MVVDRRYSVSEGTAIKAACAAASTANLTLSGEQTIDGVAVVAGDRVLVKDQTDASENGIYLCSTGNWTRTPDFDGAYDAVYGTRVFVMGGTIAALTEWYLETTGTITIGTTDLAFNFRSVGGIAGPVASVDNEIALFSGTSGQLIKRASGTGVISTTSGVPTFNTTLPVILGGTGSATAEAARTALGLAIGTDVQAYNQYLADLAAITPVQGDILYFDGTDWVRLAPGTSGQVLQTSGSGADPAWVTKASGTRQLLDRTTVSSAATYDFTGFVPGSYDSYEVEITNLQVSLSNVAVFLRTSSNGGSSYDSGSSDYSWRYIRHGASSSTVASDSADTLIDCVGAYLISSSDSHGWNIRFKIPNPSDTVRTVIRGEYETGVTHGSFIGSRESSADVDGFRIDTDVGVISSALVRVWGVRNA